MIASLLNGFWRGVVLSACVGVLLCANESWAEVNIAAERGRLVVAQEPAEAFTPTAAKEKLTAGAQAPTPQTISVAGRIGARGMEPFLDNKASFVMLEIPADDHAAKPGHNSDDCPFCKKRSAGAPMVAVQFLGSDGKVLPLDARKLFGVQKGQDVVVTGKAVFDPKLALPVIQITAETIHVRPPAGK